MTDDAAHLTNINSLLKIAEDIDRRLSTSDFPVEPGSDLAGDNLQVAGKYALDQQVDRALKTAVAHWKALHEALMIHGYGWIHSYYPLVRAALENAALAHWLLVKDSRQLRIHRQLIVGWTDLDEDRKAWNASTEELERKRQAISELEGKQVIARQLAKDNGKELPSEPKLIYVELVQSVPTIDGVMSPELVWRICSGMAHGKGWAFQVVSAKENAQDDGTTETADYSLNLHALLACVGTGVLALRQAVELFDLRRTAGSAE